jgi:hypothetical protein
LELDQAPRPEQLSEERQMRILGGNQWGGVIERHQAAGRLGFDQNVCLLNKSAAQKSPFGKLLIDRPAFLQSA